MSDTLDWIKELPDGAKLYLRPVGLLPNAYLDGKPHFALKGQGVSYSGATIHWRGVGGARATYLSAAEIHHDLLPKLSKEVRLGLEGQIANLSDIPNSITLAGGDSLSLGNAVVMGILNVTPDSFSDGGRFLDATAAIERGRALYGAGAAIIDVGGESTRPGAEPVWEGDEMDRILPVISALAAEGIPVSVDTRRASVMRAALGVGARIINDVSALTYDPDSLQMAAESDAPVVLMHAQGDPRTMQDDPMYEDVLLDVYDYLAERIAACEMAGIRRSRLIIDPGLGFGKRLVQDNGALINGLSLFSTLGCPLLVGASRKRFIGAVTHVDKMDQRLAGSLAVAQTAVENGAHIVRVHDVAETVQVLKMQQGLRGAAMMDAARQSG